VGKVDEKVSEAYGATDDVAKTAAYLSLREYGYTEQEAIKRVYEGFQNYATVGKIWDMASKTPVVGNAFIKFQADLQRILKNAALKRPLTTAMYLGVVYAMAEILSNLSGEDDEDKALRESRKFIPKLKLGFVDIPLVFMTPVGEMNLARYLSPYYIYDIGDDGNSLESYSKMLPYQLQKNEGKEKGSVNYSIATNDPLAGVWWSAIVSDRDFRGKSIQDPLSTKYQSSGVTNTERLLNAVNYISRSQVPMWSTAEDYYLANTYGGDFYGRTKEPWQVLASTFVKIQGFPRSQYEKVLTDQIKDFVFQAKTLSQQSMDMDRIYLKARNKQEIKLENKEITQQQFLNWVSTENEILLERKAANAEKQAKLQERYNEFYNKYKDAYPQVLGSD